MDNVNIAIVGSRTFNDKPTFKRIFEWVLKKNDYNINSIVSGGAKGADTLGEEYSKDNNIPVTIFKADWDKYGKRAGFIRNVDIIKNCDVCVCFWDGESHGTLHDIQLCVQYNKTCHVYNFVKDTLKDWFSGSTLSADEFISICREGI